MWKIRDRKWDKEKELFYGAGLNPLVARIIAQRNGLVTDPKAFVECKYDDLTHPYDIKGIKEASEMFCKSALNKENIAVIGDYDCDGIVSSAMVKELCTVFGLKCEVFLPSRSDHGYGLTENSIEQFKERMPYTPDLIIIVDSGSNGELGVVKLKQWGAKKVVILDHHIIEQDKFAQSADVVVNWHQTNTQEMCACGLVFQFIRGIRWLTKKVDPIEFLTYSAIGTLADVSPIVGDNRIIVKNGLKECALKHVVAHGLTALMKKSGIYGSHLTQEDVLFKIAPRINAVGRMGKPDMAFHLLIEHDQNKSELMAAKLNDSNKDRKKVQKKMGKEAEEMVKKNADKYKHGIVLYKQDWKVGIVGVVASRLAETFLKPVILIGKHNDSWKGSGRSFSQIDLKSILDDCKHVFAQYGGHKLAAGVTVLPEYITKVNQIFNECCEKYYQKNGFPEEIKYYDASLKPAALTLKNASVLVENIYPYCQQNNPEPIFLLSDSKITEAEYREGEDYSVLTFRAEKDGVKSPLKFKTFSSKYGGEVNGLMADIYFSFPQNLEESKYSKPSLNVVDLVIKNNLI